MELIVKLGFAIGLTSFILGIPLILWGDITNRRWAVVAGFAMFGTPIVVGGVLVPLVLIWIDLFS